MRGPALILGGWLFWVKRPIETVDAPDKKKHIVMQ